MADLIAQTEVGTGAELPWLIRDGYEVLNCGILARGFLGLRCGECCHDELLAFSCNRRGFCLSCGALRMPQTATRLVDHVNSMCEAAVHAVAADPDARAAGLECCRRPNSDHWKYTSCDQRTTTDSSLSL